MKQVSNTNDLFLFNQMNPETADGVFQDALGALYGMKRIPAKSSVVNCECIGRPNAIIDETAVAQSINGDLFRCIQTGTIPASGKITLQFESVETGAIPCGANTVNKIFTVVDGWDSVNNPTAGTEGQDIESRADFEARRKKELARNATGSLSSVYSALYECKGVADVFVWENCTNSNVTYRGITLTPHSIYICINGGDVISGVTGSGSVAEAIYNSKSAGCDTTAQSGVSSTCTYTDSITRVTYTYNYFTPNIIPTFIKIGTSAVVSDSAQNQIRDIIKNDWKGYSQEESITIGSPIYASRFYSDIMSLNIVDLQLVNVKVSKGGSDTTTVSGTGITSASVNKSVFQPKINDVAGTYTFSFDGTDWKLSSNTVDLEEYGITVEGTAVSGDEISVVWVASSWSDTLTYNINELPTIDDSYITFEVV